MSNLTRSVWSTGSTLTRSVARGNNVAVTADLTVETRAPRRDSVPAANLSMVKRRANVKHPVRDTTHSIESWTRTVGSDEIVFSAPSYHERRHAEALPSLLR